MFTIEQWRDEKKIAEKISREELVDFLFEHLDQFGDSKEAINASIDYAFSKNHGKGGFILTAHEDGELVSVLVMNFTGMSGYIPENILVYVATHKEHRGKGIGGKVVKKALAIADGDVKLHVEYENPAKRLYERVGFTSKYAEMRFTKDK